MVNIMAAVVAYCLNPNKPTFQKYAKRLSGFHRTQVNLVKIHAKRSARRSCVEGIPFINPPLVLFSTVHKIFKL